jgi:hypothetical protein
MYEAQLNSLFFKKFCQILNITKLKKKPWFVIFKLNFFKEKKSAQTRGLKGLPWATAEQWCDKTTTVAPAPSSTSACFFF